MSRRSRSEGPSTEREPISKSPGATPRAARLSPVVLVVALLVLLVTMLVSVCLGAADLGWTKVLRELWAEVTGGTSPLTENEAAILWQLRVPRIVLAGVVGAALACAGAAYQGVFRNPLADPYLLGAAAGAGLGATVVTVFLAMLPGAVPAAAFVGALGGVGLTWLLGRAASTGSSSTAVLLLAGVAVTAFLTAVQTFVQQLNTDTIKQVYSWMLGGLNTTGWQDLRSALPYIVPAILVLCLCGRLLDVLTVGDEEAASLGVRPDRVRLVVVLAASLATAAAVSVSGLIGFVGIVVPHAVRLLAGTSYRIVLPVTILGGATFMIIADQIARTAFAPAELPLGVITALTGAPFFVFVLYTQRRRFA